LGLGADIDWLTALAAQVLFLPLPEIKLKQYWVLAIVHFPFCEKDPMELMLAQKSTGLKNQATISSPFTIRSFPHF
jgi:hypothetical protein